MTCLSDLSDRTRGGVSAAQQSSAKKRAPPIIVRPLAECPRSSPHICVMRLQMRRCAAAEFVQPTCPWCMDMPAFDMPMECMDMPAFPVQLRC